MWLMEWGEGSKPDLKGPREASVYTRQVVISGFGDI